MRAILSRDALRQATVGNVRGMTGSALSTSFDGRITHISGNEIPASRSIGPLTVKADYTVVPGTVIGLTPEIGAAPISDVPAPALEITGEGTEHVVIEVTATLNKTADNEFVRSVTVTAVDLIVESAAPTDADRISSSGTFKILLATFVDGAKTLQAWSTSLWLKFCDDMSRTGACQLEITNPP